MLFNNIFPFFAHFSTLQYNFSTFYAVAHPSHLKFHIISFQRLFSPLRNNVNHFTPCLISHVQAARLRRGFRRANSSTRRSNNNSAPERPTLAIIPFPNSLQCIKIALILPSVGRFSNARSSLLSANRISYTRRRLLFIF